MSQKLFIIEFDKFSWLAPYNVPLDPNRTLPLLYVYIYLFMSVCIAVFECFIRQKLVAAKSHPLQNHSFISTRFSSIFLSALYNEKMECC